MFRSPLFARLAAAAAVGLLSAAPARAAFIFDVTIDTTSLSGPGSIEFQFSGADGSLPTTATITGFNGSLAVDDTGDGGSVLRDLTFGGAITFRVSTTAAGGTFSTFLYDATAAIVSDPDTPEGSFRALLSSPAPEANGAALQLRQDPGTGAVTVLAGPGVAAVPEPSSLLLVGALGAAGVARRRLARKAA